MKDLETIKDNVWEYLDSRKQPCTFRYSGGHPNEWNEIKKGCKCAVKVTLLKALNELIQEGRVKKCSDTGEYGSLLYITLNKKKERMFVVKLNEVNTGFPEVDALFNEYNESIMKLVEDNVTKYQEKLKECEETFAEKAETQAFKFENDKKQIEDRFNTKVFELNKEITALRAEKDTLKEQIHTANNRCESFGKELASIRNDAEVLKGNIKVLLDEKLELEEKIKKFEVSHAIPGVKKTLSDNFAKISSRLNSVLTAV